MLMPQKETSFVPEYLEYLLWFKTSHLQVDKSQLSSELQFHPSSPWVYVINGVMVAVVGIWVEGRT